MSDTRRVPGRWKAPVGAGWSVRKAVELAAAVEERGEQTYRALARRWQASDELRALFVKLATEESLHREAVRKLLADIPAEPPEAGAPPGELEGVASGFFSEEGWALGGLEQLTERDRVLGRVLRFENATLDLYRGLHAALGPSPALDVLIAEEERHVADLLSALEHG